MMNIFSRLLVVVSCFLPIGSQAFNGTWQPVDKNMVPSRGEQVVKPDAYQVYSLDGPWLLGQMAALSTEPAQGQLIDLPTPDGGFMSFRVWQTPMMEAGLAAKYPGIKTFTATSVTDAGVTAKLDYTYKGFHALVFGGKNTYVIAPYSKLNDGYYICYYKRDATPSSSMVCELGDSDSELRGDRLNLTETGLPGIQYKLSGATKRTYRLALACTIEYSDAVDGPNPTKAGVLSEMVTTMNRVNGVYEKEMTLTMVLVDNNDTLIYLSGTDPYSNSSGGTMLGQNQTTVNARIGSANYDIGHVFSTGGGGIAQLGCVCRNNKARGVTGQTNPVGDIFAIDFVAHEMGHQFGAEHTFNANTGSCGGNGENSTAYEPGSGSTIMAYAGICNSSNNLQAHSDDYFHAISLDQIADFVANTVDGGGSCPVTAPSNNNPPDVPAFATGYNIPFLTPFELTAPTANDADHDVLTYCWEQWDLGNFGSSWSNTNLSGPIFRSFPPKESPTRIFVKIDTLVDGVTSYLGEKLPEDTRELTFKLTVRDVLNGWGSFNFPDDEIALHVINTGTPFEVTSPTGASVWGGTSNQNVTWNVSNTDQAPISCANVDIWLSEDGGYTFPYLVKGNTPNDGTENITVPNVFNTNKARIKVKGVGNVFFNFNGSDFTINFAESVASVRWDKEVTVYPVPASDVLNIKNGHNNKLQSVLMNAVGQKVWSGEIDKQLSVPVGNLAKGVYYLQMSDVKSGERIVRSVSLQ
jgi:hypothetical protein